MRKTLGKYRGKYQNWLASDQKIRKAYVSLHYRLLRYRQWEKIMTLDTKGRFTRIYKHNLWNNEESRSGGCSTINQTAKVRKGLQDIFAEEGIRSVCDAGCGDFNWMKAVDLGRVRYLGADIVQDLILANQKGYQCENVSFRELDIIHDTLPSSDLIMCREVLIHLSFQDAIAALLNFKKSGSKFVLTTHFSRLAEHEDTRTGRCHEINFRLPPLNFATPLRIIEENESDRCLALWKLEDIHAGQFWKGWTAVSSGDPGADPKPHCSDAGL